jgi:hypothetical protein
METKRYSGGDTTKFLLECETVVAINDDGIGIRYNSDTIFQPQGPRLVLSLEISIVLLLSKFQAKRRKSKRRDDPELAWEHARQIFVEMLGQTCYKEFYENHKMEYQEATILQFLILK